MYGERTFSFEGEREGGKTETIAKNRTRKNERGRGRRRGGEKRRKEGYICKESRKKSATCFAWSSKNEWSIVRFFLNCEKVQNRNWWNFLHLWSLINDISMFTLIVLCSRSFSFSRVVSHFANTDVFARACTFVVLCLLNYRLCNIDSSVYVTASILQKFAAAVNILKAVDINCTRRYIASGKSLGLRASIIYNIAYKVHWSMKKKDAEIDRITRERLLSLTND